MFGDYMILGLGDYLALFLLFILTLWRIGVAEQKITDKIEDKIEEFADELLPDRHEGPSFLETLVREGKNEDDE